MPDLGQGHLMRMARDLGWPSTTTVLTLGGMTTDYGRIPTARRRADEGQALHEVTAALLTDAPLPLDVPVAILREAEAAAEAVTCQLDAIGTALTRVEHRYAHPTGFHGQLDIEGTNVVIDLKRGLREPSHALQLAGYAMLHGYVNDLNPKDVIRGCYYTSRREWVWFWDASDLRVFAATVANVSWRLAHRRAKLPEGETERCFDLAGPDEDE